MKIRFVAAIKFFVVLGLALTLLLPPQAQSTALLGSSRATQLAKRCLWVGLGLSLLNRWLASSPGHEYQQFFSGTLPGLLFLSEPTQHISFQKATTEEAVKYQWSAHELKAYNAELPRLNLAFDAFMGAADELSENDQADMLRLQRMWKRMAHDYGISELTLQALNKMGEAEAKRLQADPGS